MLFLLDHKVGYFLGSPRSYTNSDIVAHSEIAALSDIATQSDIVATPREHILILTLNLPPPREQV